MRWMTKKSNRALEQNLSFESSNNCITFTLSALWLLLERKYCITCIAEAYRSFCPAAVGAEVGVIISNLKLL